MADCRATHWNRNEVLATYMYPLQDGIDNMTKKYAIIRSKIQQPSGGFIEAFALGIVDLSSIGQTHYDASGYPYDDEVHAFMDDWDNLGRDFHMAADKMNHIVADEKATREDRS